MKADAVADLVCSKCGAAPEPGTSGHKIGGTHLIKRAHRYDASKRGAATIRYASCGFWQPMPGAEVKL